MRAVFIGPMLRGNAGKAVLHCAQDGQLADALKFNELAALMAATLDDPTGWEDRQAMSEILVGLIRHDGLPHEDWTIRRTDLARFADRIKARQGELPVGLVAWIGVTAEISTPLVTVSTKRLVELLRPICPTIRSLTREYSRTDWLKKCAVKNPDMGNDALSWDYWLTVETMRNHGCLTGTAPDPDTVKTAPILSAVNTTTMHKVAR